ncbi:kinesin-like protein KIN-13A [Nicotiana tomentosiformis]|uniref:kinesin-like protein KIN-13A n=1 Tax=Nicotiana tomentosiformis TaxID=4098 RepID=UPI00388C6D58
MGGQVQQSNAEATALYDHPHPGNAGYAVMARFIFVWMFIIEFVSNGEAWDCLKGYGTQSMEEKQRLFKLMRNLNFNGESASEPYTPTTQSSAWIGALDGFNSPEFKGDFGAGLLDLHSMDDTELLSEHVISEPFEPSPFMPAVNKAFDGDFDDPTNQHQKTSPNTDAATGFLPFEKQNNARENNVAKIKVVVRKRPLNKEIARKEDDVVTVSDNASLTVHEPKLKMDLTAYVEKHEFCFDFVLDEHVTNDEVYRATVQPIIPIIFQRTKATCFAYGQTGCGKTYTMQPLPLRAADDLVGLLHQPIYRSQAFKLWLSFFEIYGGKLFDLLGDRKKFCMREDGRQQVCIVGLQEFEILDVQIAKEYIEKGNTARSTGSTGANEESSRSHAILQLAVKKHNEVKDSRQNNDGNDSKSGKVIGKISFIDLAGSERGADTTDMINKQGEIEGAEINKSLLALKECIRALDNDQIHIPFRGSKLTEVLRDSFVGNSRTVMISCISPNTGSCEHTLNTLIYTTTTYPINSVKSLSKSGNSKKDQIPTMKEPSSAPTLAASVEAENASEQAQESKESEVEEIRREKAHLTIPLMSSATSSFASNHAFPGPEESGANSGGLGRDEFEVKNIYGGQKMYSKPYLQSSADTEDKVQKEMKLLAEVDQPGSLINNYVTQLSFMLSRKAASMVSLQAHFARFQQRLKQQEILSRKRIPRQATSYMATIKSGTIFYLVFTCPFCVSFKI